MALLSLQSHEVPQTGQRALLRRNGLEIALFNIEGHIHAIGDSCPHAGAALCTGRLEDHIIQCPAHGLRFDVRTGAMPGNAAVRVRTYPVLEREGCYVLDLPNAAC
ncbi:Rieske (2Fe-2S) protein [Cupriavidus sp. PET2-C1]